MRLNRSSCRKTLALATSLSALTLFIGEASAFGLGKLTVHSHLGAVFYAEVQLIENAGDTRFSEECFRLNRSGESESGIPVLTRGRLSLERQGARSKLIITSDQFVNEPVLQINLRAGCGAEVIRSYTVLVDPVAPQQAHQQALVPAVAPSRAPEAEKPVVQAVPASQKPYPKDWQTAEGESAKSIAAALFPRQPSAQRRFLNALRTENPQLDLGEHGEAPLSAGITVTIPDTRRFPTALPKPEATDTPTPKPGSFDAPTPAHRSNKAKSLSAGRMAYRLVISSDDLEGSSGNELPLRLSTELTTRFSDKTSESARSVLRVEYRLLNALYAQATQQLDLAEQVRNLETGFEEMRIANENAARNAEAIAASAKTATPVAPATHSEPKAAASSSPARLKQYESSNWWLEILVVLALVCGVTLVLARRSRRRDTSPPDVEQDKPAQTPTAGKPSPGDDPWAEENERKAIQQATKSGTLPDIVIDETPSQAATVLEYEKTANTPKHIDLQETNDCSTAMELAEIMICFGRVHGATQALEEFLAHDPGSALAPWMKLLEIYRMNDMKEDFETCSAKLRTHFNVAPSNWEEAGECLQEPIAAISEQDVAIEDLLHRLPTIATMPHIVEAIQHSWNSEDGLVYLEHLLRDTRDGKRSGFPLAIARELLFLVDLLKTRLQRNSA